jgi:plastocyanin
LEKEESKPGGLTIVVIIGIAILIPILVTFLLVSGFQPTLNRGEISGTQPGVTVIIPDGVGANTNLNFEPVDITVVVGVNNTIKWVQEDPIPHTVTSTSVPSGAESFDSKNMNKGDVFTVKLTVPGKYNYFCFYHPGWMKATITVKG